MGTLGLVVVSEMRIVIMRITCMRIVIMLSLCLSPL